MTFLDPAVSAYVLDHCTPADDVLQDLADETQRVLPDFAGMQVSLDEGRFLSLLVGLSGARDALEVGVFTGYSSICIARELPPDGRLLALDVSEEFTSIARPHWARAGVAERIELRIGPALASLAELPETPSFDFAFIDADKTAYPDYYEAILPRLRPGGLVVLDNVLREGRVVDPTAREPADLAIKALNDTIAADPRVTSVMLPVRDGVTLARKLS
ncbi:class I SAM-dependent methyltransferase [Actinocorallia sp. API 0066]|uniref:O-methyltransferase n=1 Tax=Actinocorallia sp. API 0066 TaxID=2896846 RepID=UPI001E62908B|nr:class I SAM-dependent methyltransferase [Actinocorallia sp. API 0066]MCD0448802.1 class I SAM-dependent methyltransferase [Actinocorallia sp. API 0066]